MPQLAGLGIGKRLFGLLQHQVVAPIRIDGIEIDFAGAVRDLLSDNAALKFGLVGQVSYCCPVNRRPDAEFPFHAIGHCGHVGR